MKITDVTTTELFYPDVGPVQSGTALAAASGWGRLFVHIKTDEGTEGLGVGEASPGARGVVESGLRDLLLDRDPFDIERLWSDMFWRARRFGRAGIGLHALSAVDIGLWDLKAKALGLPLYKLLGPFTDTVPVYGSGGWANLNTADLTANMTAFVEQGVKRVKMKVGKDFGRSEREDIERVAAVREAVGDNVALYIDANSAYYPKQAIYMAEEFARYQVGWFEEPVLADDVDGLAEVRRAIPIPVATGENEYTKHGFRQLITGGGVDIVQPDVGHVGGVTEWMKVAQLAHAFNLPVAPHAMEVVHLHLACATPNLKVVESLDIEAQTDRVWYTEVPQQEDGMLSPFPDKPGLGLELDPYAVEKWSV